MTAKFLYTEKHFHSEFLKLKKRKFSFFKKWFRLFATTSKFSSDKKKHFSNDTKLVCRGNYEVSPEIAS